MGIDVKFMKKILLMTGLALVSSCSPRDFLSRRLAADLILASETFRVPQHYVLETGIISNKDYLSPEYLVLQHRGWIAATPAACRPGMTPPCWDILLTPAGVETVRALVSSEEASKPSFAIPVARRDLIRITGISKHGNVADVDFTWRWAPLNEIGAALYSSEIQYKSTVGFRDYDDGWRMIQKPPRLGQSLDDALRNAEPGS
jgi:hypothetical protein